MSMREMHHRRRKPWADRMAEKAALGLTRRSIICRVGYATAALLGARFLVADGPRALAKVAAKPCAFDTAGFSAPGGGKCGKNGVLCNISSQAALCSGYAACPGCLQQLNGCPQGSKPENSWTGCCTCPSQQVSYTVKYTDCCSGTITNQNGLPPVCSTNCIAGNAGCPNNQAIGSWCNGVIFKDNYICTAVFVTSTKC